MDKATRGFLVRLGYLLAAIVALYYVFTVGYVIVKRLFAVLQYATVP